MTRCSWATTGQPKEQDPRTEPRLFQRAGSFLQRSALDPLARRPDTARTFFIARAMALGHPDHAGSGTTMRSSSGTRRHFVAMAAAIPAAFTTLRSVRPALATDYGATPSVPANQGLQRLMDGNQRFVAGQLTAIGQLAHDRGQLVPGQSPFAVIVSCSDSRVPP